jgi:hypothetical protein
MVDYFWLYVSNMLSRKTRDVIAVAGLPGGANRVARFASLAVF